MKRVSLIFIAMVLGFVLAGGSAFALDFGTEITIYDENGYKGSGIAGEDQETEPGMINNQSWDLEGIFVNKGAKELSIVGGFDFVNGVDGYRWAAGDIFIDVDGDAEFGDIDAVPYADGKKTVTDTFGYDYVMDMDFAQLTYNVYLLTVNSQTETTYYKQNAGSNPFRYVGEAGDTNGISLTAISSGAISYQTGLTNAETGFLGDSHYSITVDIDWLSGYFDTGFTVHMTQECGNDNIIGTDPVPEPATIVLLGVGLLGIGALHRRNRKK